MVPTLWAAALDADCAPVRVRLLGENFGAFRATDGRVGFFFEQLTIEGLPEWPMTMRLRALPNDELLGPY